MGERGRKDGPREGRRRERRTGGERKGGQRPSSYGTQAATAPGAGGRTQWTHSAVGSVPGHVPRGKDSKALEK